MCASSAKICKTQINFVSPSVVTQNGQNFLVLIIIYSVLLHPQQKSFKMFSMCTVISVLLRNMHVYLVSKRTTLKHFVYVIFICTVTCSSCSWLKLDLRCTNCKSLQKSLLYDTLQFLTKMCFMHYNFDGFICNVYLK